MATAKTGQEIIQQAYDAFGRGDLPALMDLIDDAVEWKFVGPKGLPYTGAFRGKAEIARWFASIPTVDDVKRFEPREFFSSGQHVTVLGWEETVALPSGKIFQAEWAHLFTVRAGRIVQFWGIMDTEASAAARR